MMKPRERRIDVPFQPGTLRLQKDLLCWTALFASVICQQSIKLTDRSMLHACQLLGDHRWINGNQVVYLSAAGVVTQRSALGGESKPVASKLRAV